MCKSIKVSILVTTTPHFLSICSMTQMRATTHTVPTPTPMLKSHSPVTLPTIYTGKTTASTNIPRKKQVQQIFSKLSSPIWKSEREYKNKKCINIKMNKVHLFLLLPHCWYFACAKTANGGSSMSTFWSWEHKSSYIWQTHYGTLVKGMRFLIDFLIQIL